MEPEGWKPEGWSPEGWRAQNFAFFLPSPAAKFKRRGAQMCAFGVLWLSCASPGGPVWWGRRGSTRQPESLVKKMLLTFWKVKHCKGAMGGG